MKNNTHQNGFTLIELMVVIAILGILMAYAIPTYRNYSLTARRGECNAIIDGLKTPIAEYKYKKGVWPSSSVVIGYSGGITGEYVNSVSLSSDGSVQCDMDNLAGGKTITWTASLPANSGSVQWRCIDAVSTVSWTACP